MRLLKVRCAWFIVILLLGFFSPDVPSAAGCSASAQCGDGQLAWCETFGNCEPGGAHCEAIDCIGVRCTCDGVQEIHACLIPRQF